MLNKIFKMVFVSTLIVSPIFVLAQGGAFNPRVLGGTTTFFENVLGIIQILIPIAFALAVLFFFWGIARYIWYLGKEKESGKQIMIWGVIAIFVMSSIWGIVSFIGGLFWLDPNAVTPHVPTIGT
jgi:hypothetical protein